MTDTATLAPKIYAHLADLPEQNSIPEIMEATGATEEEVVDVLNNYTVAVDGILEHAPGQGGGWLPEEIAEQYRTDGSVEEASFIGYRWPDGELRDEIFDKDNPEHLSMLTPDENV